MAYYIILFVITTILAWFYSGNTKVSKPLFFSFCLSIGLFVGLADMLGGMIDISIVKFSKICMKM